MKAVVLSGPQQVAVRDFPTPEVPAGGMLVRVAACGICGSDLRSYRFGLRVELPWQIPGHEAAGTVMAVGEGVTGWAAGDRIAMAADVSCYECEYCRRGFPNLCQSHRILGVHIPGGMAEVMALGPEMLAGGILHKIPEGVPFDEASMAEPASSVLAAQEEAGIKAGETVLIIGAGPMGCLHAEAAVAKGAGVLLLDRSAIRLEVAAQIVPGARLIDSTSEEPIPTVRKETGGFGADVAIVAAPTPEAVELGIASVAKRGRVVLFGGLPKDRPHVSVDINLLHYSEISLIGSFSYRPRHHAMALEAIAKGQIKASHYITHRFPLDQVEEGFKLLAAGQALKVVILP